MIKTFLGCIKESALQWDLTILNGGEYSHRQKAVLRMCVFLLFLLSFCENAFPVTCFPEHSFFFPKFLAILKSNNLQYNMLGRWVDRLSDQALMVQVLF